MWDWVLIPNFELRINYLCIHDTTKRDFRDFQILQFRVLKFINTVQSVQSLDSTSSGFLTAERSAEREAQEY